MAQSKHKYRVSVYLGKEIYEALEKEAYILGISIATLTKLAIESGFQLGKALDKGGKATNGKQS